MVESAPRLNVLRTGETTRNANTAECLGYGTVETGSGVNEIGAKKLAKRRLAPCRGFEPRFTDPKAAVLCEIRYCRLPRHDPFVLVDNDSLVRGHASEIGRAHV